MVQCDLAYGLICIFLKDSKKLAQDLNNFTNLDHPIDIDQWLKDAYVIDGLLPHIVDDMIKRYKRINMSQEIITKDNLDYRYICVDIDSINLFNDIVHNVSDKYISMAKDEYAKVMISYIDKYDNMIRENRISEWINKINLIKNKIE